MAMTVLVAYASERGSTQEIAEHVAARLTESGLACTVRPVDRDPRPEHFDAVVLGSAVHGAALLPAAVSFVEANEHALSSRPLWLFSVGLQPSSGHHRRAFARLIAGSLPREVPEIRSRLGAIDYRAFAGVLRASETKGGQRLLFRVMGGQFGDFRDWPAIDRWADGIAARLATGTLTGGGHG
jgi:menaquinone-dependent protoporphyrinogen oxidase